MRVLLLVCGVLIWSIGISQTAPCPPINEDCNDVDWILDISMLYPGDVEPGVQFCVPMTVNNFISIISMEFTITFDPSVLQFDCADAIFPGSCLPNTTLSASNLVCTHNGIPSNTSGNITFLWFNVATLEGVCCNDGSTIMELCFTPIGDPGQSTFINITNNVTPKAIEVGFDFTSSTYCNIPCTFNNNPIVVACNALNIIQTAVCTTQPGTDNGSFGIYYCGGTPPYDYVITQVPATIIDMGTNNTPGIEILYENLAVGTYTIAVTDGAGATDFSVIDIFEGTPVDFDLTGQNPNCWDRDNGTATVSNVTGGTPGYQYTWSTNQFGSEMIDNLGNGTYTATVSDAFGCKTEKSIILDLDTLKVFAMLVDSASCAGADDAVIKIWAEGGVPFAGGPGDFYEFNGNAPTDTLYINDATGGDIFLFQAEDQVTCRSVEEGLLIPFQDSFAPSIDSIRHIVCHGEETGYLELLTPLATSITVFLFDANCIPIATGFPGQGLPVVGAQINKAIYNNLPAGDYKTRIRINAPQQFSGCQTDFFFSITEPDTLILSTVVVQPNCVGGQGSITASATGGVLPYTFKWDDGFIGDTRTGLPGGNYQVTVCDDNMCIADTSIDMNMAGSLAIKIDTISLLSCDGGLNAGSLEVTTTPANPNYCYEWKDVATNMIIGNTAVIAGLGAGEYFVLVEDKTLGCQAFASATIDDIGAISFLSATESIPDCYGTATGSVGIQVDMSFGTPPYSYNWDGFPMNDFSVLPLITAGTYCVTVSDANNCAKDTCLILMNPDSITLNIMGTTDAMCFGGDDGSITVEATGGSTGATSFSYFINDDQGVQIFTSSGNVETFSNLEAGCYTVIAADQVCTNPTPLSFCIDEAPLIELDQITFTEPSCFGLCDGMIDVTGQGGTGNLSFQWTNSTTAGSTLSNICAGWHYVNITDQYNCTVLDSVLLTEPDSLVTSYNSSLSADLSCFNSDGGIITIDVDGGTPNFMYSWTGSPSSTLMATDLTAGVYTVTVTDQNLCTSVLSHTIDISTDITMQINTPDPINCFGAQTSISIGTVNGGLGSYSYSVNFGPLMDIDSSFNVIAGPYTITVFDSVGCSVDTMINIPQPNELTLDIGDPIMTIALGDSTILQASVGSSLTIDSFIWAPEGLFDCLTPDCQIISINPTTPTTYTITVVDGNGCTATDQVEVLIDDNRSVYIPTAFSPNGDGINDLFNVFLGPGIEEITSFNIFDRWGERVFYIDDSILPDETAFFGWDGTFKQRPLGPGVFAYLIKIKFVDQREITYRGSLTLMR